MTIVSCVTGVVYEGYIAGGIVSLFSHVNVLLLKRAQRMSLHRHARTMVQ